MSQFLSFFLWKTCQLWKFILFVVIDRPYNHFQLTKKNQTLFQTIVAAVMIKVGKKFVWGIVVHQKSFSGKKEFHWYLHKNHHTVQFYKKRSVGELPSSHFPCRGQKANNISLLIFDCAVTKDIQKCKYFITKLKSKEFSTKWDQVCILKWSRLACISSQS